MTDRLQVTLISRMARGLQIRIVATVVLTSPGMRRKEGVSFTSELVPSLLFWAKAVKACEDTHQFWEVAQAGRYSFDTSTYIH